MAEAATEEIVTRFTADLTDLEQGIAKAGASLKKYEDYAGGAAASGNQLNSNLGSLTAKTMALEGVQKRVVAGTKEEAAALGTVATSMRVVSNEQSKLGNTAGFDAAGKAADEEAQKIAALIERINQLKAAHASAGTIEAKGPIAADIGTAQAELSAIPIPQGAQNTAEIASALAPLQAIREQAPLASEAVDKAAGEINADLESIGDKVPLALSKSSEEAINTLKSVGAITEEESKLLANATAIVEEFQLINAEGEQFPGHLAQVQGEAKKALVSITGISAEEAEAVAAAQQLSGALGGVASKGAAVNKPLGQTPGLLAQIKSKIDALNAKKLTLVDPKAIQAANAELHKLNAEYKNLSSAQPNTGTGIAGLFKTLGGPAQGLLGQASSGLGSVGSLFTSLTGPVGIALGAVAAFGAGIGKVISNTDDGKRVLEGLGRSGGIAFDTLTGKAKELFASLTEGDGVFARFARGAGSAIQSLVVTFNPLAAALKLLGKTDTFQQINKDGQDLARTYDDLDEAQTKLVESNAKNEREVAKLSVQLRDRTKTEAERLEIAKKIDLLESSRADRELQVLQQETAAVQKEADIQLKAKGEVDDELKRRLAEAKAAEERAAADSETLLERTQNRRNAILQEGDAKRATAAQKEIENTAKRIEAETNVTQIVKNLQDQQLRTGLSTREQEAFDIDQKYDDLVTKATDSFAKLRKLAGEGTPGADTAAIASINAKQKEVDAQINAARDREQTAATQKATADEIKVRQDGQNQVLGVIDQGNKRELDALRSKLSSGITLTATEQANFLDLIARVNEAEIKAAQDKYAKLLEDNKKYNSDALGLTEQGKQNEADLIAQKDAEIAAAQAAADEAMNADKMNRLKTGLDLLGSFADQSIQIMQQTAKDGQLTNEEAAKQIILLALDTLEKIILMNAVNAETGAIATALAIPGIGPAGAIIQGAIVAALIKGLFAAVKGQILGAYTGEDYIGGTPTWSGRDGHLRRVHTGERIVTAKTNAEHFDLFQAAEGGVLHDYLSANYVLPAINNYLESDDGRRVSTSIMVPKYHDANVVRGLKTAADKTDRTNELLYALLKKEPRVVTQSRRSWN